MSPTSALGRSWDDASSPAAARIARRFELDWRGAIGDAVRPDPTDYLPDDPSTREGAWLALLRAEMSLRFEAREPVLVEAFRARHPELDGQVWVALLYEEFCLREEAGQAPNIAEYERRFPDLAPRLRRVLDIHALVGASDSLPSTTSLSASRAAGPPLPERGQTIGGFRLVEELGRGTFARVFRAEERQLADRPVALKVARAGSREPQTLAMLQHTHIVPVHSYRIDPVTGLHLLCMPYFGRVTLAMILADPSLKSAKTGADLLAVLDRLEGAGATDRPPTEAPAIRRELARRAYSGAIAWWGARLAEALGHAHERGVLHRDLKPSNVLVTANGLPMLLDFNLAGGPLPVAEGEPPAKLGGTLAYMAPEHLEALADGLDEGVDARSDVFALGVVLYEALCGKRPFGAPRQARSMPEALMRAADERRVARPEPRRNGQPIHPALAAVLVRSLAADPRERYVGAAEMAADLQAVADDLPLRFAVEPFASRSIRWIRRNRRSFALAAPLALTAVVVAASLHDNRVARIRDEVQVRAFIQEGKNHQDQGDLTRAVESYHAARDLSEHRPDLSPELAAVARDKLALAIETRDWRAKADALLAGADKLNSRLLGFVGEGTPDRAVAELLAPFFVLDRPDWIDAEYMTLIEPDQRRELVDQVHQLLFLWIAQDRLRWHPDASTDDPEVSRWRGPCERVLATTPVGDPRRGPWLALGAEIGMKTTIVEPDPRGDLDSDPAWAAAERPSRAAAAFFWGVLRGFEARAHPGVGGHAEQALAWLERACREEPNLYWARFFLAPFSIAMGRLDAALEHAEVVVALRPDSPWSRFNRAEAFRARGEYERARDDLELAAARVDLADRAQLSERIRLNLGVVRQALGDAEGARALYDELIANGADERFARSARLNRAGLDVRDGRGMEAKAAYDALIAEDPDATEAYAGRARLALAEGRPAEAEADLTILIERTAGGRSTGVDGWLALRARARLRDGRSAGAVADAEAAEAERPSAEHQRLELRARLAARRAEAIRLDDPEALDLLPMAGPALAADARAVAEMLDQPAIAVGPSSLARRLTRVALLAAIGDPAALVEADRAVKLAPDATATRLVRARVLLRSGRLDDARRDVEEALALVPDEPRLLALRGAIRVEQRDASGALEDLDRALSLGLDDALLRRARARALAAVGRPRSAITDWTRALEHDPTDPTPRLDRGRLLFTLGASEFGFQDFEAAASWAAERPDLLAPIAFSYVIECGGGRRGGELRRRRAAELIGQVVEGVRLALTPEFE